MVLIYYIIIFEFSTPDNTETMKKIGHYISKLINFSEIMLAFAMVVAVLGLAGYILQPLSPIFTLAFTICATALAVENGRTTAIEASVGLSLFVLAWPALHWWGTVASISIWASGVLLWFWAVLDAFANNVTKPLRSFVSL